MKRHDGACSVPRCQNAWMPDACLLLVAREGVDLSIRSLSLPYFNRIGCYGPCGMTLVFCSLRHCTGPHPVLLCGWLLPSQPHPCHSSPPPPRLPASEPQPSLNLTKSLSRNRTKGTTLWEDPGGPKTETQRDTSEDHAPRAPGSERGSKAAWAMGLPLHYVLHTGCDNSPRLRGDSAPSLCPLFATAPVFRPRHSFRRPTVRGSPAPALCLSGPAHGVGSALRRTHARDCCAVECLICIQHNTCASTTPGAQKQKEHDGHECSSISRVDPQATRCQPCHSTIRRRTNERTTSRTVPPPVFPPSAQPWAPIGAYAPTWPVGSSSVSGTASSASAPAPAPQAPCISAASYRISSQPWQPEQARPIRARLIGKRPAVPQPSINRPIDRRRPDVPSAPARGIDCCCDAPDSSQTEQASPDRTAQVTHAYTHIHVHTHMHGQAEDRGAGSERERKKESPDQPDQQASKHASSKQKKGSQWVACTGERFPP